MAKSKGFIFITRSNFRLIVTRFEVWLHCKNCHALTVRGIRLNELRYNLRTHQSSDLAPGDSAHHKSNSPALDRADPSYVLVHIIVSGRARIESLSSGATATAMKPAAITRPPARLFISGERRSTVLCLLLVLLTLAFYNPIVHNGFTNFDDNIYITDNAHVRAGLTWDTVKWAFTSRDCGQLASADLAVARSRLPAVQTEPRWSPLCKRSIARGECDLVVSAVGERHGIDLAQLHGRGVIRSPSCKC
jgi:hypothetical protein